MQQEQVYHGAKGTLGAISGVPSTAQLPSTSAHLEVSKIGEGAGEHQLHGVPTVSAGWSCGDGTAVGHRWRILGPHPSVRGEAGSLTPHCLPSPLCPSSLGAGPQL